jgi:hypothetical protein
MAMDDSSDPLGIYINRHPFVGRFGRSGKSFLSNIRQVRIRMDGCETYKENEKAATAEKAKEAERHLL